MRPKPSAKASRRTDGPRAANLTRDRPEAHVRRRRSTDSGTPATGAGQIIARAALAVRLAPRADSQRDVLFPKWAVKTEPAGSDLAGRALGQHRHAGGAFAVRAGGAD